MKTKDFIKRVEELGWLLDDSYVYWQIRNEENLLIAVVHKNTLSRISTDFVGWWNIEDEDRNKLFDLIVEYSKTPISERNTKMYYVRHRWVGDKCNYLIKSKSGSKDFAFQTTCYKHERPTTERAKFTMEEIKQIEEDNSTSFTDFELIEVKYDD